MTIPLSLVKDEKNPLQASLLFFKITRSFNFIPTEQSPSSLSLRPAFISFYSSSPLLSTLTCLLTYVLLVFAFAFNIFLLTFLSLFNKIEVLHLTSKSPNSFNQSHSISRSSRSANGKSFLRMKAPSGSLNNVSIADQNKLSNVTLPTRLSRSGSS